MAGRSRIIKHEFARDEDLAECSRDARLLAALLPTIADREGRLEDRPKRIHVDLFPYPGDADLDIDGLLRELETKALFVVRYVVDGRRYVQIRTFLKHQDPHVREAKSTLPSPPDARPQADQGLPWVVPGAPKADQGSPKADLGGAKDPPRSPVPVPVPVPDPVPVRASDAHARTIPVPGTPVGESIAGVGARRYEMPLVAAKTPAFLRVWERYPCKKNQARAAPEFARAASGHPGGEEALAQVILDALAWQIPAGLGRAPRDGGEPLHLRSYIADCRWTDAPPAARGSPSGYPDHDALLAERHEHDRLWAEEQRQRSAALPAAGGAK